MNEQLLAEYTEALNKATAVAEKMQKKKVLHEGVDDQLLRDFEQANAEVSRLTNQLLSMSE